MSAVRSRQVPARRELPRRRVDGFPRPDGAQRSQPLTHTDYGESGAQEVRDSRIAQPGSGCSINPVCSAASSRWLSPSPMGRSFARDRSNGRATSPRASWSDPGERAPTRHPVFGTRGWRRASTPTSGAPRSRPGRLHSSDALYGRARACIPPSAGNHAHGFWQLRVGRVLEHEPHRVGVRAPASRAFDSCPSSAPAIVVCAAPDQARIRPPRCPVVNQPRVKQKHVQAETRRHVATQSRGRGPRRAPPPSHPSRAQTASCGAGACGSRREQH